MPLAAVPRPCLPSAAAADGLFAGYPVRRSLCHLSSTLAPVPRQGRPAAEGRVRLHRHIAQDKAARPETPKYALATSATTTGAIRGRGQEIGYVTKKKESGDISPPRGYKKPPSKVRRRLACLALVGPPNINGSCIRSKSKLELHPDRPIRRRSSYIRLHRHAWFPLLLAGGVTPPAILYDIAHT